MLLTCFLHYSLFAFITSNAENVGDTTRDKLHKKEEIEDKLYFVSKKKKKGKTNCTHSFLFSVKAEMLMRIDVIIVSRSHFPCFVLAKTFIYVSHRIKFNNMYNNHIVTVL